jgi:N-acyl-D-amino-acid deacylase
VKRREFLGGSLAGLGGFLLRPALAEAPLAGFDEAMFAAMEKYRIPGAALAIADEGRLVYARGFGFASVEEKRAVQPTDLFRICSISKPLTAVAIMQLVERGRITLETRVWEFLELGKPSDRRWKQITLQHLLQHTGGWDRDRSFDPMFASLRVAGALAAPMPAEPAHIIRYMLRRPLEHDPGSRFAYSNFGYCLLGRVIERASGGAYEKYVKEEVLAPLGIKRMRIGKTLPEQRAPGEVSYYDDRMTAAVVGRIGERVPQPYGGFYLEAMDSHGGWLGSAVDLARFGAAFVDPERCPLLKPESVAAMFARPEGGAGYAAGGAPREPFYGLGWILRTVRGGLNVWHTGSLRGSSTLLLRRFDGKVWAVLFNQRNAPDGARLSDKVDRPLHEAANRVAEWPKSDQFPRLL